MHSFVLFSHLTHEVGVIIVSILQMRKVRFREVE